jgi:hypothetical protein
VIQSSSKMLKRAVGEINWIRKCKQSFLLSYSSPFRSHNMFAMMSLCITVIVWQRPLADSDSKQMKTSFHTRRIVPGTRTVATTEMPSMVSPMEIRSLHWRNINIDIISRSETTLPTCAWNRNSHAACMCWVRRTCCISHVVAAREQTSPSPVLTTGAIHDCGYPSIFVPYLVDGRGSTYNIQSTQLAMGNYYATSFLIPTKILCRRLSRNRGWRRNRTECNTGSSRWRALPTLSLEDMSLHVNKSMWL